MPSISTELGVELAFEVTGEGSPIVLVHGITEDHRTWDPLVGALAASHRVVAVDLRGHGRSGLADTYDLVSMARDVHDVVRAVGVEDPLVVGHSLGGAVVTAYAAVHSCRGAINVDQPLDLAGFQSVLRELEPQLRGDSATFEAALASIFEAMAGPLDAGERRRVDGIRQPRQEVVLAIWDPVLASTPEQLDALVGSIAGAVTVPYLSLHGIDPGPDYPAWLTGLLRSATIEVWPDHGHYPHLVDPERFLARLASFDASLDLDAG